MGSGVTLGTLMRSLGRNGNGLTFTEWLGAAGKDASQQGPIRTIWYSAWEAGEDPCEWKNNQSR